MIEVAILRGVSWRGVRIAACNLGPHRRVVSVVLALCVLGAGCGEEATEKGDDRSPRPDVRLPRNIVTDGTIDKERDGTPSRALLSWWQAIQYKDADEAIGLTSPATLRRFGRKRFERLVNKVGSGMPGIRTVSTQESGSEARVRSLILSFKPGRDLPDSTLPTTLTLSKRGNRWLVASNQYLRQLTVSFQVR